MQQQPLHTLHITPSSATSRDSPSGLGRSHFFQQPWHTPIIERPDDSHFHLSISLSRQPPTSCLAYFFFQPSLTDPSINLHTTLESPNYESHL
mmetsp:Transcript_26401/g.43227  ORF Transcript_26401/g.43227 Transcript_26401/m.43227 type:complete len:93 (-) Transcript_26401:493-771(-)